MAWLVMLGIGCGGDNAPKQWHLWAPLQTVDDGTPDDPYALYCGDDFAWSDNWTLDLATNEAGPLPNDQPIDWRTNTAGPVTCVGRTLFTYIPGYTEIHTSVDGGPWEQIVPDDGEAYGSIMASSRGITYRTTRSADGRVRLEESPDAGATWTVLDGDLQNPRGGDTERAALFGVEGFLSVSVVDVEGIGGTVRVSLDGATSIPSIDNHRELASPIPLVETPGGTFVAYDPDGADLPAWYFPSYQATQRDPLTLATSDYDVVMLAGPKSTLDHPDPSAHPQALSLRVHPDGHLLRRDDMRTTAPLEDDQRDQVLLGENCQVWEWSEGQTTSGPSGQVTLTHTGTEPVWVGTFLTTRLTWFNAEGVGAGELLQPGETRVVDGDGAVVFFMDEQGRCRGALMERDGGDVDVGDWL